MDYSSKEGFVSKAKWIFSSLSGIIMLWASGLPSPMQIPRPKLCHCRLHQSGLKTLIYSQGGPLIQNPNGPSPIITSHVISPPPLSASPSPSSSKSSLFRSLTHSSSWSSATDDLLGTESGVYMKSDYEQEMIGSVVLDKSVEGAYNRNLTKRSQRCSTMPKKYPPPLSRSHLPRVLTRHYENGNLVLKEKGIKQYFETTRENGRLIVNLMQLDDNIMDMEGGDRMTADEKNNEELEPEGKEFIKKEEQNDDGYEEYQQTESDGDYDDDYEEYQETESDGDFDEAKQYEGPIMILAAVQNMRKRDDEERSCGELRKCFTYTGSMRRSECDTKHPPGLAPLAVTAI